MGNISACQYVRYTGKPQVRGPGDTPGGNYVRSQCGLTRAKGTKRPEGNPVPVAYLCNVCCAKAMTNILFNIATPLSGAEHIIMVVFLSLLLEPETGCGYGKVSNSSVLDKVHLQGKRVMTTAGVHIMNMRTT